MRGTAGGLSLKYQVSMYVPPSGPVGWGGWFMSVYALWLLILDT